jgi:hypothetical protein
MCELQRLFLYQAGVSVSSSLQDWIEQGGAGWLCVTTIQDLHAATAHTRNTGPVEMLQTKR